MRVKAAAWIEASRSLKERVCERGMTFVRALHSWSRYRYYRGSGSKVHVWQSTDRRDTDDAFASNIKAEFRSMRCLHVAWWRSLYVLGAMWHRVFFEECYIESDDGVRRRGWVVTVSGINISKKQKVGNMAENITRKSFAVHAVIDWLEYRRNTQDTIRLIFAWIFSICFLLTLADWSSIEQSGVTIWKYTGGFIDMDLTH